MEGMLHFNVEARKCRLIDALESSTLLVQACREAVVGRREVATALARNPLARRITMLIWECTKPVCAFDLVLRKVVATETSAASRMGRATCARCQLRPCAHWEAPSIVEARESTRGSRPWPGVLIV